MNGVMGNGVANKMITNIDMFCLGVIITVLSQRDRRLIIAMEGSWVFEWFEDLADESTKPNGFLCGMGSCNVLCFCGGEHD